MEPARSLPHSQVPASCIYPELPRSSPYSHTLLSWATITYLLTYLLNHSMERSPSEAKGLSASEEIPYILWNPKVHYRIHKCLPTR